MSTKVNVSKEIMSNDNSFLSHFMIELMAQSCPHKNDMFKLFGLTQDTDHVIDVKITFNGVEVQFDKFVSHLESHFNKAGEAYKRDVEKEAVALLQQKMDNVDSALHKMCRDIKLEAGRLFPLAEVDG
jgi:hypothetical protein